MTPYPRLAADLAALAEFGRRAEGGWDRPAYSAVDCQAHQWLADRMAAAGLQVRTDPAGNVIGRLAATVADGEAASVMVGSHLDTVQGGGRLDGALGVLAGVEVARRLAEGARRRRRPLEIVAFRDEEGRFGALVGSRAMTGRLALDQVAAMRDAEGVQLADALRAAGLDAAALADAARSQASIAAYLELHIEQGPVLEAQRATIGVVTAIAGQVRFSVRFTGRPDHAGTTPMHLRRDAFAAAAEFATAMRERVLREGVGTAVGTVGIVKVTPNVGNVVPAEVRLGMELRDVDGPHLDRLAAAVIELANAVARRHNLEIALRTIHRAPPSPMDPGLREMIAAAATARGLAAIALPSGAGHDAQNFSGLVPTAMIFVPSKGGRSHCPEEDTDWPDLCAGVAVLGDVVGRLVG